MCRTFIYILFSLLFISCTSNTSRSAVELKMVDNIGEVNLSDDASKGLEENGFILTETSKDEIYDVYSELKKQRRPIFITTDIVLHTDHLLFDYILRIIEIKQLYNLIGVLSKDMFNEMTGVYNREKLSTFEKEALERNIGFFAVACEIFKKDIQIPKTVEEKVEKELKLIEQADSFADSPLFGCKEDYSQYKPRGHYTRNETFRRYFKAMMWFGRMAFFVNPPKSNIVSEDPEMLGMSHTLSALYITYSLKNNPLLLESYNKVYRITSFFVGESDDLGISDYQMVMKEVYGKEIPFPSLSENKLLSQFIQKVKNKKPPLIISGLLTDVETDEVPRAFKFMGQRFIPDSYIFQNLVYDKVTNFTGTGKPFTAIPSQLGVVRGFPRGLDVMSVLGCEEALEILKKEGDASYKGYNEQLDRLKKEFSLLKEPDWRKNLYYRIIYQFKKLLDNVDEFKNPYLDRKKWVKKILNTLLGAWAELRHDTILYAKQSYTVMVTSMPPHLPKKFPPAYVEAYPSFFTENRLFIIELTALLEKEKIIPDEVLRNLRSFDDILKRLIEISVKENKMEQLDEETTKYLHSIPSRLEGIVKFSPQIMEEITDGTDSKMALIADVHTDVNTKQVLEVGVGSPLKLFIVVPVNNKPYLMEGATFSYYEFKEKMANRLTDAEWQEMIEDKNLPPLQHWFKEFVK
ncbi:MAG: DUF3160 domain-containing protein [Candidatus Cloacimonadota bacterium]|nr:MAG: DUF3160 domain-containing protein [Candidatus Cloacimonadota bacterium]